jgi:hypothetical protein
MKKNCASSWLFTKMVVIFSTTFVRNNFHSKKIWKRYDHKCILVFIKTTRYSCQIVIKFEFSRHIFEKLSDNELHETPYSRSRVFPCGRTDGQRTDMTKPPVVSRNFANTPKNESLNIRESKTFEQTSWNMHSVSRSFYTVRLYLQTS